MKSTGTFSLRKSARQLIVTRRSFEEQLSTSIVLEKTESCVFINVLHWQILLTEPLSPFLSTIPLVKPSLE